MAISACCHRFPRGSDDSRQLQVPSRKQQLLLDSLQSADVSTDAANKQLAIWTAEASCVNKTEFELLHGAVTSVEEEKRSTWLWPRACG